MTASAAGRRTRILVVEDEPMIAFVIEDAIDAIGGEMLGPIGQLDEAMVAARNAVFDCALLDVNICGRQVFPVAEILLERGIPFAFATGYALVSLPAHLAGVPRLTKPYTTAELEHVLMSLGSQVV